MEQNNRTITNEFGCIAVAVLLIAFKYNRRVGCGRNTVSGTQIREARAGCRSDRAVQGGAHGSQPRESRALGAVLLADANINSSLHRSTFTAQGTGEDPNVTYISPNRPLGVLNITAAYCSFGRGQYAVDIPAAALA